MFSLIILEQSRWGISNVFPTFPSKYIDIQFIFQLTIQYRQNLPLQHLLTELNREMVT